MPSQTVQVANNPFSLSAGSKTTNSITNTAGNTLVLCTLQGSATENSVSDLQGNTYTYVNYFTITTGSYINLFYCQNCKAGANTATASFASTLGVFLQEIPGLVTSVAIIG